MFIFENKCWWFGLNTFFTFERKKGKFNRLWTSFQLYSMEGCGCFTEGTSAFNKIDGLIKKEEYGVIEINVLLLLTPMRMKSWLVFIVFIKLINQSYTEVSLELSRAAPCLPLYLNDPSPSSTPMLHIQLKVNQNTSHYS